MERLLQRVLDTIVRTPLLLWGCVVANLVGVGFGLIVWYGPMLLKSPAWAFPFIPDCPLAALLGTVALLGVWANRRWTLFYALTAFACMKYGAWTLGFWLHYWSETAYFSPLSLLMFVTHIGLSIEGLLFVVHIRPLSLPGRLFIVAWFALSVYVDYGLGYSPPLGGHVPVAFAFWLALGLTALLGLGLLMLPYGARAQLEPVSARFSD